MAKFLWVGKNYNNISGSSSKAYCIRRLGKTVVIKYGPVQIRGAGGGKYYWIGKHPKIKSYRFTTIKKAIEFIKSTSINKQDKGYHKLLGRVGIRKALRDANQ